MATRIMLVTTTVARRPQAAKLVRLILEARLAACIQTVPIRSDYWWAGRLESAAEVLLLIKTRATLVRKLTTFIRRHHPYEVPEIVSLPVAGGLPAYLAWVTRSTAPAR
jgi:periplasmic divalent cation tolerance protein